MEKIIKPLASWKGQDRFFGEVKSTLTAIFLSGGCSWNRCRMCGYKNDRDTSAELIQNMKAQVSWLGDNFTADEYELAKIFTSGSVFDSHEVPLEVLDTFGTFFKGKPLVAESRCEYVTKDAIERLLSTLDAGQEHPLTVAIGLETTNDAIREKSIDKGNTFADFKKAAETAHACGASVKAYLMMKPLFLTEKEAMEDMAKSIKEVAPYADMISMNLCTVQGRTELEQYWRKGAFRPPYLWSAVKVLLDADTFVSCDPVGGGFTRGPHNGDKQIEGCLDKEIVAAINEYSLTADKKVLQNVWDAGESCRDEWQFVLDNETSWNMPLTH
ncbi:MAG TPA: archaeosine biosynthesis radical SAM protein RaSEA [Methanocorpusculum sp.]|nr:archaeosine biosynthesis radical SAM protein RaSEA [Methanocorpusculum sp.]